MNVKCFVPGPAASAVVVDETVDGGVDHEEEMALRNVPQVRTCTRVKSMFRVVISSDSRIRIKGRARFCIMI